jgi:DNA polymerase-3 subunit alpha
MIAYQTAWLKANYSAEYMAALMTIAADNTDKLLDYIRDCQAHDIDVLPPCLNESERAFRPLPPCDTRKRPTIRFGLCAVKNVGDGAVQSLLDARKSCGGAFESPLEIFEQADQARVNKRVMENLIKAGAFDFSGVGRGAMLSVVGRLMSVGARRATDRAAGQGSLFGATPQTRVDFEYPQTRNTLFETLALEHDALGFYLSGHPMDVYTADVERYAVGPIACAEELPPTKDAVRFVGRIGALREQTTRNKDRMAFVELEDSTSRITCLFFAAAFARSKRSLVEGDVVLVTGSIQNDRDKIVLRANSCESIATVRERSIREVILHLKTEELAGGRLGKLLEVLEDSRGGCKARMRLVTDPKGARLSLDQYRVSPMPMLEQRIQALFGRADVLEFR